jgi:hypothetical protein
MTSFTKSTLGWWIGSVALLAAMGCSAEDPNSDSTQEGVRGANAQCEDEEEANDKITCSVDADCDSDETCVNGLCTGADGETEGDADADDCSDAGDADDDEDDADDEEDEDDKITCATDANCDSDKICIDGLCAGLPESCEADTDCDSDESCTNGLCEDR